MSSYFERSARPASESWRALRHRRAHPPIAEPKSRARTFQAALEQAEQQFRAASAVGYDSRPLNLFYGLSQAGRAIAAAAPALSHQVTTSTGGRSVAEWQLDGHGVGTGDEDIAEGIADVRVLTSRYKKPGSSFKRLSALLNSDIPDCALGDLWVRIWDAQTFQPLQPGRMDAPITVERASPGNSASDQWPDGLICVRATLPAQPRPDMTVAEFLTPFPQLTAGRLPHIPTEDHWPQFGQQVNLYWPGHGPDAQDALTGRFTDYRGRQLMAIPVIGKGVRPPHPLMLWWAALFTLSMLARYHPDRWTEMIDVDRTASAVAVEYLLDIAIDTVPDLIDRALDQVPTS